MTRRSIPGRIARTSLLLLLVLSMLVATPVAVLAADETAPVISAADAFLSYDGYKALGGLALNDTTPRFRVTFTEPDGAVDASRSVLYVDGVALPTNVGPDFLEADAKLRVGAHTLRALVTNDAGLQAESTYTFKVTAPKLVATVASAHWGPRAAWGRLLHVKMRYANAGTGKVWETRLQFASAQGATYMGRIVGETAEPDLYRTNPSLVTELAPGGVRSVEMAFRVPRGVTRFTVTNTGIGVLDEDAGVHPLWRRYDGRYLRPWRVTVTVPAR